MENLKTTGEQFCKGMGFYKEGDDIIKSRDIHFIRDGKNYVITVSTPDYWKAVQESGEEEGSVPHYTMDEVTDVDKICQSLSEKPLEDLLPFLTEAEL